MNTQENTVLVIRYQRCGTGCIFESTPQSMLRQMGTLKKVNFCLQLPYLAECGQAAALALRKASRLR